MSQDPADHRGARTDGTAVPSPVVDALRTAQRVLLLAHLYPDGDVLGSQLGLGLALRTGGRAVTFACHHAVPETFHFLPGATEVQQWKEGTGGYDLVVTLDTPDPGRVGGLLDGCRTPGTRVLNLDHHADNRRYGDVNWIEPRAAATGEMVYAIHGAAGFPLTRDVAICLYTGIVTDTGRFQYANTSPEVLEMATELSRFDLPIAEMSRQLFEEHRFAYLQLVATALQRAELDAERRFVATWITVNDLDRFGVEMDEAEGLIDIVRRTEEADVSCVLKESAEGTKVSLRSVTDFDVAAIAMRFGGGCHKAAAGFTDARPIPDVLAEIRAQLPAR